MSDEQVLGEEAGAPDLRDYCRTIEDHLTRVNGGHLVRIVGPGFDLVRQWAADGIPLGIVTRGIDLRVERHKAGQATRPLRVEFCDGDVRHLFDQWRRAVGLTTYLSSPAETSSGDETASSAPEERRQPSLAKHLERAIARLSATAGQLDGPEALRDAAAGVMEELIALRDRVKTLRGAARDDVTAALPEIDRRLIHLARTVATPEVQRDVRHEAEQDLAGFRRRLSGEAWERAVETTMDQRLRARFGLPLLEV